MNPEPVRQRERLGEPGWLAALIATLSLIAAARPAAAKPGDIVQDSDNVLLRDGFETL
jgi:hypothetical protein